MESNIPEVVEISGLMQETKDRMILMHLPTSTIAELLDIGEYPESDNIFNFSFINSEGVNEELRLLVHKSDYDKNEADEKRKLQIII